VLGRHSRDSNRIQMNRCSWGDFSIFLLLLGVANEWEYDEMMAGDVPSVQELGKSSLKVVDPPGGYGQGRLGVPALMRNGKLYILGRNGEVCMVGDDQAGSSMLQQARLQINKEIARELRELDVRG